MAEERKTGPVFGNRVTDKLEGCRQGKVGEQRETARKHRGLSNAKMENKAIGRDRRPPRPTTKAGR